MFGDMVATRIRFGICCSLLIWRLFGELFSNYSDLIVVCCVAVWGLGFGQLTWFMASGASR